jgi:uncharacterized protein (TIRG00374 family)
VAAAGAASRVLHGTRWAGLGQRVLWLALLAWLLLTAWQLFAGAARPVRPARRATVRRVASALVSLALIAGIFLYVLPQVADFDDVWAAARDMTWIEVASLALAAAWNITTYLLVMVAVLPGLTYWQAFVVGQSSTAIATALPAGSALGVGVTYMMYSSFGRSGEEIGLAAVLTGLWNNFVKLGLPVVALAILAVTGTADGAQAATAVIGLGLLLAAVGVFALMLRSDALARRVGAAGGRVATRLRRLVRRRAVSGWDEAAVRFRADTIDLLRERWRRLTVVTVLSHLSLFAVLLLALRHMDVSGAQVSWPEALAAFAVVRLVTALPITPGGVGPVELLLIGALVLAGGARAGVVAAVLIYRFLTLVVQVPIGGISYLLWRRRRAVTEPA